MSTPSPAPSGADDRTFEFLLNAMESAAASREPFKHGYAEKRAAVFAHVTALEAEVAQKDAEIARLKAALEQITDRPCESTALGLAGVAYCADSHLPDADLCSPCRARRALAPISTRSPSDG